jgi:XTP/dITP diphosphohydrolase
MQIWIATSNQGKLNEFKMLLNKAVQEKFLEIHSQGELPVFSQPPENGDSFVANARIKARALKAMKPGMWVMGEDSGLAVEGLNGMPGIHSARYAGPKAQDAENTAKVLKMMVLRPMNNRNAAFVSVVVAFDPQGVEHVFEGRLDGEIAKAQKGSGGFGYDNIFIPKGETKTLAELGLAFKNKVSHRALAVNQLLPLIMA